MSPARHALPARLDLSSAADLAAALRGHEGSDLTLEAGEVTHLGTPGLQVLLAARRSWQKAGRTLSLAGAEPGLEEQLGQLGLALSDLTVEGGGDAALPSEAAPPGSAPPEPGERADGAAPGSGPGDAAPGAEPAEDASPALPGEEAPPGAAAEDAAEADAPAERAEAAPGGSLAGSPEGSLDGSLDGGPDQDTSHEEE